MSNLFEITIHEHLFHFQPFNAGTTSGYHVDVKGSDGKRYEFRIERDEDNDLHFEGENLPPWIDELRAEIKEAVNQQD